ncbi:MAG: 23S rRNA (adenine(2503)-C(2))-methyltransferase RlmN [Clostridiales bacterium]|jgi:23S rRNA (adenine2503-C2)-methyltransferase|nr:23S rRNA (adenine(2503)-C(2))-methyltransferase RlmN [Clostridiales bacterium]
MSVLGSDGRMMQLADMDRLEMNEWLAGIDPAAYRAAQVFRWIGRGAACFDDMTDLPRELRARLASRAAVGIPEVVGRLCSARDGTVKYVLKTADGNVVESVLMEYRHGFSVCVSSQAGCRMGCAFCASRPQGFARSLSPGEMFGQVAAVSRREKKSVGHVVVMGIGEPFDNYDGTLKFVRLLHEHEETNIGYRKVTISTSGILPGILRLSEEGLPIGLSVSLHASNDAVRERLMPVNRKYSIDKLLEGCKIYTDRTKRRVTFEYALIAGVNDAPGDARELARRLRHMLCHVNLIPVNRTEDSGFRPSPKERVRRFAELLSGGGVQTTVRRELGSDIAAACGQLRNTVVTQ